SGTEGEDLFPCRIRARLPTIRAFHDGAGEMWRPHRTKGDAREEEDSRQAPCPENRAGGAEEGKEARHRRARDPAAVFGRHDGTDRLRGDRSLSSRQEERRK